MAKTSTEYIINMTFDDRMSNEVLREWVRFMSSEVNDRLKNISSYNENPALESAIVRSKLEYRKSGDLKVGIYKTTEEGTRLLNKKELITRARDLQRFIKADVWTSKHYEDVAEARQKSYEKFKTREGMGNITYEEYENIIYMSEGISDIFKDYGSEIQQIYNEYRSQTSLLNFGVIARQVYSSTSKKGKSVKEFRSDLLFNLRERLANIFTNNGNKDEKV